MLVVPFATNPLRILVDFSLRYANSLARFARKVNTCSAINFALLHLTKTFRSFLPSMTSHDCVPNCIYDHVNVKDEDQPPQFEVVLRSKGTIKKGEKIFISYVDILLPTYIRQKNLFEVWKRSLCHSYRLSPSNQGSHTIFENPISLKWREANHIKKHASLAHT